MKHLLCLSFLLLLSVSLSAKEHSEQQPSGIMLAAIWLTSTEGDKIETYQKDGKWFGKLVASNSKDAPLGTTVLRNLGWIVGQWCGQVYSIKRDQEADCTSEPSPDILVIDITAPHEDARFRKSEQFIIKAHFFIKGHSGEFAPAFSNKLHPCSVLKKKCNAEYDLLSLPQGAGLETLYTALLILTIE
jgi:hypothetical protein